MPGYARNQLPSGTMSGALRKPLEEPTWAESRVDCGDNANAHLIFYTVGIMV